MAYQALADQLNQIDGLRFLYGDPRGINALNPSKTDSKSFKISDEGLSLNQQLQQKEVARQCAEWIRNKVEIRSIRQANLLHGKLYHIADGQREHVIFGSSNFTQSGLGLAATSNYCHCYAPSSRSEKAEYRRNCPGNELVKKPSYRDFSCGLRD